jgi:hypothetical protein
MPECDPRDASLVKPILMFSRVRRCFKGRGRRRFIWLVWSIWFISLLEPEKPHKPQHQRNQRDQTHKSNQIHQMNQLIAASRIVHHPARKRSIARGR